MNRLAQKAPQSFQGRMFQQNTSKPQKHRILVLKTGIAGLNHHINSEEEAAALRAITPGTELMLFREPDNEYDA